MTGMVPSYLPIPILWVYLTGVALIAAGIAVFINNKAKLALQLLGLMLILFVVMIHLPGGENSMPMVLKDLALAGGAWILSGKYK